MVKNPTTLGHHVMEVEVKDEPARRKRAAEQVVAGATRDAIEAFTAMQEQARDCDQASEPVAVPRWRQLLRRITRR